MGPADVTTNLAYGDRYISIEAERNSVALKLTQKKFFDESNFTTINKRADDRKSPLRKEKQAKKLTGAPAKARVKPTELQIMLDVALGGSRQMTYVISSIGSALRSSTPPLRTPEA